MPWGLASYIGGIETIHAAEPLAIFYQVRLTDLKTGRVTLTLPGEASASDVIPFLGPSSRNTDSVISMGGPTNGKGKVASITVTGNTVTIDVVSEVYGVTYIQVAFFNGKGVTCLVSN